MNRAEVYELYKQAKEEFSVTNLQMLHETKLMGRPATNRYIASLNSDRPILYPEKLNAFGGYLKKLLAYKRGLKKVGDNAKTNG